jgi:TRAP transporter 4TM/12TM fusion protein
MDERTESGRLRTLAGAPRALQLTLLCLLPVLGSVAVLDLPSYVGLGIYREQYLGVFIALILASTFLSMPPTKAAGRSAVPWYDWLLAAGGLLVGLYVAVMYPRIAYQLAVITPDKWLLGTLTIVLFLEATRRVVGWVMLAVGVGFILYAKFGYLLPGMLQAREVSWERLSVYLYLDTNGLLGLPLAVGATVVLAFIFFGNVLFYAGGAQFLGDFALAAMGRFRGGPAKMAVVASSLFGTISGSAVSNVAVDGPVTIPMMKRAGFPLNQAAAIEAVASTGGQLMPPVMGVAAFLIAEFLAIPYSEVALAALVPALLYYITLFVQIDLEAAKRGLRGLPPSELPALRGVLRDGWLFALPLALLVYVLFVLAWPAGLAALAAVLATLVLAMLRPATRLTPRKTVHLLESVGKGLLDIGVIVGVAGFVIGVLQLSGLAFKFSMGITAVAGGNLFVLLLLTAAASIVLGMGMPTAAVYILLAVLVAPALVQLGVVPLAAHLFVFYFGMMSMLTPPVCLAAYTAAAIARTDFMSVAWAAMRLSAIAFIVPFLFAYSPELILRGEPFRIALAVVTAIAGASLLGAALTGYLFQRLSWLKRAALVVAALGLLTPASGASPLFHWSFEVVGVVLAILVLVPTWYQARAQRAPQAEPLGTLAHPPPG